MSVRKDASCTLAGNAARLDFPDTMNSSNLNAPKLNLARNPEQAPFFVDMERFFEFSFWIAEELLDLVALHQEQVQLKEPPWYIQDGRLSKSDRFCNEKTG